MEKNCIYKSRTGAALVISTFVAAIAAMMLVTMMSMAEITVNRITDDRSGKVAFYAAEAGLAEVIHYFNVNEADLGKSLSLMNLPTESSPYALNNNAEYWVESIQYQDSNTVAIVDIVGNSGDAYRKIRSRLELSIPAVFNDFGLLTDGILTIHGTKILKMSIHGNAGLDLSGENTLENNAVASQSSDPTADPPHSVLNPVGGYIPKLEVPTIPIDAYRTISQSDGIFLDINQEDFREQIDAAPVGSKIYITTNDQISKNDVTLSGNLDGKTIFFDGDVNLDIDGSENMSNGMIVTSGDLVVNGSIDIVSSNPNQIDVVFASGGDVDLNGSRSFQSLFWSNGRFTQNGASLSGRVIAQEAIFLNGSFILTNSDELSDLDAFDKVVNLSTWHIVPMS